MGQHAPIETDAVVIGAGPVGLFQAFQLGLQELRTHIIDALPYAGGQCVELYADKPIYDIPGIPVCSGRELIDRLQQQLQPFKVPQHLGQVVQTLQPQASGRWLLETDQGLAFDTATVFIAAGVGAFVPRRPVIDGLAPHENGQVHYHAVASDRLRDQQVVVMGGEDAALETALQLVQAGTAARVTLLHRVDKFKTETPGLETAVREAMAAGTLAWLQGQPTHAEADAQGRLSALQVATLEGPSVRLPVDALLPRLGLSPKLGPVAEWGLAMERKHLVVNPETYGTSAAGIYAVGDVNHYPGKRKLIVCGFHEATLAAFAARAHAHPDQRILLQYTTTSPRLHELLGVAPKAPSA